MTDHTPDAVDDPLRTLAEAAFVSRGDELVARRIARAISELTGDPMVGSTSGSTGWPTALLALAVRAAREGSSALDLRRVATTTAEVSRSDEDDVDLQTTTLAEVLTVPSDVDLAEMLRASALARQGVVHVRGGEGGDGKGRRESDPPLLIMDRHDRDEELIAQLLTGRQALLSPLSAGGISEPMMAAADAANEGMALDDAQRAAVRSVLSRALTVLTGGPGMGKTYTLAAIIRAARAGLGADLRLALAAPTGKAAARMTESLRENGVGPDAAPDAITLHRLLGYDRRNTQRFIHDASNPLPHDLVVVDEASMLSLAMTARLLEALKPTARLLLVGDPDQLASVEAGSVLSDLVAGLDDEQIVRLTTHHRLSESRRDLAMAFAAATPDEQVDGVLAVLHKGRGDVHHLDTEDVDLDALPHVAQAAWMLRQAAAAGDRDAALEALRHHRLLCAHRTGPYGVARWNRLAEASLTARGVDIVPGRMYVGRPVLVTKNDPGLGLFNGDTGVVIDDDGRLVVLMDRGQKTAAQRAADAPSPRPSSPITSAEDLSTPRAKPTEFSPWRLGDVETMHAMTVHKAQGSQAEHVTVIVPPVGSRLLTREMLYTALTRASQTLTVIGTEEAVRTAVRSPVQRSSGLARRLRAVERTPDL